MLTALRHTDSFATRSFALALAVLFCTVRMAAAWHTHEAFHHHNTPGSKAASEAYSIAGFDHSSSPTSQTTENDDCPLCHVLSQGIAEIALVAFAFALALMLVLLLASVSFSPARLSISCLSDRAPPRFA